MATKGVSDSLWQYSLVHNKDLGNLPVGTHCEHSGCEASSHLLPLCCQNAERELADLCVAFDVTAVV